MDQLPNELILPSEILQLESDGDEGQLIVALAYPFQMIFEQVKKTPSLIHDFSHSPRAFEEFIAAAYHKAGFKVTLTPQSGDLGRDVIAEKEGFGAIRLIDQCKALGKGNRVTPNDVRALMGTLMRDTNSSKAVLTTTSVFSPSVIEEWKLYMPNRLELREGDDIVRWIDELNRKGGNS